MSLSPGWVLPHRPRQRLPQRRPRPRIQLTHVLRVRCLMAPLQRLCTQHAVRRQQRHTIHITTLPHWYASGTMHNVRCSSTPPPLSPARHAARLRCSQHCSRHRGPCAEAVDGLCRTSRLEPRGHRVRGAGHVNRSEGTHVGTTRRRIHSVCRSETTREVRGKKGSSSSNSVTERAA